MLRWLGLLCAGAIGLHELRYLAGPGAHSHEILSAQPHAYLPLAGALVLLVFVASVVHFALALLFARRGELESRAPVRFSAAWLWATLALLAIFVTQESLEGALVGGHSAGLHGLLGHGGWSVLAFAPLVGVIVAVLLKGAQKAIELAALAGLTLSRPRPARTIPMRPPVCGTPRLRVLARNLAGRAPPLLS